MFYKSLCFKYANYINEFYNFGGMAKITIVGYINNIYMYENIRLGFNKIKQEKW